ncbi:MAG: Ig-like domain-containing protein [Treponema sp.]|nr:Ig-like domain-containing protein [Treponema sp.]
MNLLKRSLSILFTCTLLFSFFSCENFFEGSSLLKDLDKELESAATGEVVINLKALNSSGSYNRPTNDKEYSTKLYKSFNLEYEINNEYKFNCWKVLDSDGNDITDKGYVEFENVEDMTTSAKILKHIDGLTIYADCYLIPKVVSITPNNTNTGVTWDTDIVITFNKPIINCEDDNCYTIFNEATGDEKY